MEAERNRAAPRERLAFRRSTNPAVPLRLLIVRPLSVASPIGQHCCPIGPCQILPRHTRLVYAGFGRILRFVAAAPPNQARTGPRVASWRNAGASRASAQIARRVNRLTVARGKSRVARAVG